MDASGDHPYATIPGGDRQRTLAYRFGVNLVMYALTGNYKGDQVHVPAILELHRRRGHEAADFLCRIPVDKTASGNIVRMKRAAAESILAANLVAAPF